VKNVNGVGKFCQTLGSTVTLGFAGAVMLRCARLMCDFSAGRPLRPAFVCFERSL